MRMRWARKVECMGNQLVKSDNLENLPVVANVLNYLDQDRDLLQRLKNKPINFQVCKISIVERLFASPGLYSTWK